MPMQRIARIIAWCGGVIISLIVASVVFVEGWELPPRFECGGGDSCVAKHIVGPGEVCVSAGGGREVRATYEELREATQRRRLATLAIVAGVLSVPPAAAVLALRARRRRPSESHGRVDAAPPR